MAKDKGLGLSDKPYYGHMILTEKNKWRNSVIRDVLYVLPKRDRQKITLVVLLQIFMGLLDLLGVAIIGVLGALAVSGVQSSQPGNRVSQFIEILHLSGRTFQEQAAFLGIAAASILVFRTLASVVFTRRTLFFLSRRGAALTTSLVSKLLSRPLLEIQLRTTQDAVYALTSGVNAVTLGVLGTGVVLISDISLLLVMTAGLFVVDPLIATLSVFTFSGIGILIYRLMHQRAEYLGREESVLAVESNEAIVEVLSSYREAVVRNRREYYAREIGKKRWKNADVLAELAFMPNISKYIIETTVVIGALSISAAQFILQDAAHAIATLAVFLAAGTRIAPAVLRVQQGALAIKSSVGVASPTLRLIKDLENAQELPKISDTIPMNHVGFRADVNLSNVSLSYASNTNYALKDISLYIPAGSSVALVGPSGAGKTSLVDVILGVITPESGTVRISGRNPIEAISEWPGAIGYVPQDVIIANGTVRENIALGYPSSEATDEVVYKVLKMAQLEQFVRAYVDGADTSVGERGTKISGGQRQRLGIARALLTNPKLLVLDEATSALDGETEAAIAGAIHALKGSVTVVMIAHRLSTVREADLVVYMSGGRIEAVGTFEEIRLNVPEFNKQARLMGL
jgi:ABC-type multidrug transport system fused ATPase/permease subunit